MCCSLVFDPLRLLQLVCVAADQQVEVSSLWLLFFFFHRTQKMFAYKNEHVSFYVKQVKSNGSFVVSMYRCSCDANVN